MVARGRINFLDLRLSKSKVLLAVFEKRIDREVIKYEGDRIQSHEFYRLRIYYLNCPI